MKADENGGEFARNAAQAPDQVAVTPPTPYYQPEPEHAFTDIRAWALDATNTVSVYNCPSGGFKEGEFVEDGTVQGFPFRGPLNKGETRWFTDYFIFAGLDDGYTVYKTPGNKPLGSRASLDAVSFSTVLFADKQLCYPHTGQPERGSDPNTPTGGNHKGNPQHPWDVAGANTAHADGSATWRNVNQAEWRIAGHQWHKSRPQDHSWALYIHW